LGVEAGRHCRRPETAWSEELAASPHAKFIAILQIVDSPAFLQLHGDESKARKKNLCENSSRFTISEKKVNQPDWSHPSFVQGLRRQQ
jgi:hypothetical protein